MFDTVTLDQAADRTWDVIIAGSSFASMFFLRELSKSLSVLVIEKGDVIDHATQLAKGRVEETFSQTNHSDDEKTWVAHSMFGGNSNCWWGQTPRFHANDFRMRSTYNIMSDWPLSYDTLEPLYGDVERVMEVAGGGNEHVLPRRTPFPFPPHIPSRSDVALRHSGNHWFAAPSARSNGGSRAPCCTNGVCDLCPVDAKFTILNGLRHFTRANVALLPASEVRALRIEAGTARAALVRHADTEKEIRGTLFALGANAIFNAAILLRSGLASPALGAYLHEQASRNVRLDVPMRSFFGGTSITGHGYALYDGPHRADVAGVLIENFNWPASVRPLADRWTERLTFKLIAEDMPQERNRVTLDSDGEVHLVWHGHSTYAKAGIDRAIKMLPDLLPVAIEGIAATSYAASEGHIQGTTRMGLTMQDSVVDATLKTHEARNVLALGAGTFPTCAPANPTLTLSALSIHAARHL
tara:strand:- start:2100 stop:3506 length:1407 start_codon:yes stop_codon:yes gene_type:complete